jgi:hypothetical protein
MKNEIIDGVQGLPGAAKSNAEDCRQAAQNSQNGEFLLACPPEPWRRRMLLARFGGDSVNVNPPGGLGFQAVKAVPLAKMPCNFIQTPYNEQLTT